MRKFTKRRTSGRKRPSFRRRVAFVRKSFRKGFKPRTSLKRSRYSKFKKTMTGRRAPHNTPSKSFTRRVLDVVSAPNYYNSSEAHAYATTIGICQYAFPVVTYEVNDLVNIFGAMGNSETVNAISTFYTDRVYIVSAEVQNTLTNACNSTVNVEMYRYQPRRDVPLAQGSTPLSVLITGLLDAKSDAISPSADHDVTVTPFQSPSFVQWYKITNKKTFRLAPGKSMRYVIRSGSGIVHRNELYNDATQALLSYRKMHGVFFKIYGEPVTDTSAPSTVSLGACKVALVSNMRYNWRYIPSHQSHTEHVDYLPTTFSGVEQHIQQAGPNTIVSQLFA